MSSKYEKIKRYYNDGLWNAEMVHNAIGKWITAQEAAEILGITGEEENESSTDD